MSSLAHDNSKLLYLVNNSGASSISMKSEIKTMFLSRVLSLGNLLFWGTQKIYFTPTGKTALSGREIMDNYL